MSAHKRLLKELMSLPKDGVYQLDPSEDLDVSNFVIWLAGPDKTPFENGYFKIHCSTGDEFPAVPPKCVFATRIFHPNVSKSGEICVSTLKKDWNASYGITHILQTITSLLIHPNASSALDEEAGRLILEDYSEYERRGRLMCGVHANAKPSWWLASPSENTDAKPAESTESTKEEANAAVGAKGKENVDGPLKKKKKSRL